MMSTCLQKTRYLLMLSFFQKHCPCKKRKKWNGFVPPFRISPLEVAKQDHGADSELANRTCREKQINDEELCWGLNDGEE
jgi:hypothetical protein